jgi:serine protease Do
MQASKKLLIVTSAITVAGGSFMLGKVSNIEGAGSARAQGSTQLVSTASANAATNMCGNTIADIAEAIAPAVVNIEVEQEVQSPLSNLPGGLELPFGNLPFGNMEFFFNGQRVTPNGPGQGGKGKITPRLPKAAKNSGSGVIIRPDGYILTNAHVVRDADKIKVRLNDQRVLPGKVVGVDNFSDIAVVKIDGTDFPAAKMGSSVGLRPGEFAVAIGNPLGFDHTVTLGIISAVKRSVTDVNGNINFIQTDAAINPGNSGGPLLNLKGDVIGINTAIQANAQNIGFSIPIDIAKSVAEDLIAHKPIVRPWLGIAMQEVDETMAKSLGLPPTTKGVVIGQVMEGSPAQSGGLVAGDVIVKVDGKDMASAKEVQEYVRSHKVSDTLNFFVLRNNAPKAVAVNIGQYPDRVASGEKEPAKPKVAPPTEE